MKKYLFLLGLTLIFSCAKKEEKAKQETCAVDSTKKTKSRFVMYQASEMAALMEQMYVDNQRLKERIKNGDTIGKFPNHFLQIHKAVMTDESDNDAFFKQQAEVFIKAQELIYEDPKNAKQHFNEGVDACVQCHQQKCGGPIPRIKKLYIQ
ncbi:MAG TPA: hypothetical protein VK476_07540 [Flavobacterium sp.]|nr:hypothetical protein [Flavobacterium sp.]